MIVISYPIIHTCPVCSHSLHVTRLECSHCHTTIENDFILSKFASFSKEQLNFVEVFLLKRGNIKEVEKELSISYPTVRSRLNEVVELLRNEKAVTGEEEEKTEVISMLERDEISVDEALTLLKRRNEK